MAHLCWDDDASGVCVWLYSVCVCVCVGHIILCDIQFLIYMQNHHLTHLMLLSHTSVLDHGGANLHLLISLLFLFDERLCEILYI